jgi:hypothetical protein
MPVAACSFGIFAPLPVAGAFDVDAFDAVLLGVLLRRGDVQTTVPSAGYVL